MLATARLTPLPWYPIAIQSIKGSHRKVAGVMSGLLLADVSTRHWIYGYTDDSNENMMTSSVVNYRMEIIYQCSMCHEGFVYLYVVKFTQQYHVIICDHYNVYHFFICFLITLLEM